MISSLKIRKAKLSDAKSIENCVKAAYGHYIQRIGKSPGPMLDDYRDVVQHQTVFVAESDKIVGVLVLIETKTGILLDNVAVHPDLQGKGLGRRLVDFAEFQASNKGFEKLDLYTHEMMNENIEFYKALGYTETERKLEHGYNRVYMQKLLTR